MPTLPLNEARDALQRWGDELAAILERAPAVRRAPALREGPGPEHEDFGSPQALR